MPRDAKICHRTRTALLIHILAPEQWDKWVASEDEGLVDRNAKAKLKKMIREIFQGLAERARNEENSQNAEEADSSSVNMLRERWRQVGEMARSGLEWLNRESLV